MKDANILIELNNGGNPWCLEELEDAIYNTPYF